MEETAQLLAADFAKVAHLNPRGLTDSWVLFQMRNAYGSFLTPRQALKLGKMARAAYEMRKIVEGWK